MQHIPCSIYSFCKLSNQPRSAKTVTLHFDRISRSKTRAILQAKNKSSFIKVFDHGAWSSVGRRKAQEDTFGTYVFDDFVLFIIQDR